SSTTVNSCEVAQRLSVALASDHHALLGDGAL
ncbi:MAG: hypothetical protein ACI9G1_005802, partial [Pirellulaceae bacterium]